jgi:hypothetical protein
MTQPERDVGREEEAGAEPVALASVQERIEEVRRAIIDREAAITARRATLASPAFVGGSPMERHAVRVRELQASLASARAERDAARATVPAPANIAPGLGALFLLLAFSAFVLILLGHGGR